MKKILKQISIFIATIILNSCSVEYSIDGTDASKINGMMKIEVLTDGAIEDDYIHTARFIVFDNTSVFPTVDVNKVITIEDEKRDAKVFSTILKVSCNSDKSLVVILNEPGAVSGLLKNVTALTDLEGIAFFMADVFNENHTATVSKGIPMTGMIRNISVTEENDSESSAEFVDLNVKRAVARVELWLRTGSQISAEITTSTSVTLSKSYDKGCLMAPDVTNDFGRMLTVDTPDKEVTWRYTDSNPMILADTLQLVCAFYTPERTCSDEGDADKLVLGIRSIKTSDMDREATIILSEFSDENGHSQNITEIRRNNVYKIAGSVKKKMVEFEQKILPWTEVGQGVIIDPQYFLTVSKDDFYLSNEGDYFFIKTETDYDRIDEDRGFPKGICLGVTRYYDSTGQQVDDINNLLFGWLVTDARGKDGDLIRDILFYISGIQSVNYEGCYATVEIKAGNLIKLIVVRR